MQANKTIKLSYIFAAILIASALQVGCFVYFAKNRADSADIIAEEAETPDITLPDISELATENEKGESVFAVSVEDFIRYFNAVYSQRHWDDYLNSTSSDNWYWYSELSPRFGYESTRYQFTADKTVWPMPTVSVYSADNSEIYELRMTFDDHGYQERFYVLFRELCVCMEKLMIQELTEAEADELFEVLRSQAYTNFFGDHHAYGDLERPPLYSVYRYNNIGMYCFYGAGNIEICFIPLTENAVEILESENVKIIDCKGETQ